MFRGCLLKLRQNSLQHLHYWRELVQRRPDAKARGIVLHHGNIAGRCDLARVASDRFDGMPAGDKFPERAAAGIAGCSIENDVRSLGSFSKT